MKMCKAKLNLWKWEGGGASKLTIVTLACMLFYLHVHVLYINL